ncbi:MAG: carbohydrate binding domain-containing protein [Colwellia sp.]
MFNKFLHIKKIILTSFIYFLFVSSLMATENITVQINTTKGYKISDQLVGAFYEDLSYAADGGLYAELIQNRSFDYSSAEKKTWTPLTSWTLVKTENKKGQLVYDMSSPIHPNNPTYAILKVGNGDGYVGIENTGFDGIKIEKGKKYRFSIFARQLSNTPSNLIVQLINQQNKVIANGKTKTINQNWHQYEVELIANQTTNQAKLLVKTNNPGYLAIDMVSLFPKDTYKNRKNGLRKDLANVVAGIKPKFMRFPGGCLVHGDGIDNMYNWKNTVGPVEHRKGQRNIWGYHQTVGLGYYEYFQFSEDMGAEPLPVIPAAVTCQNSGASITGNWGEGQMCVLVENMPALIQDIYDLIEWANGPVTSKWGKLRAQAGHPAPFNLKYLGIGNEDRITDDFQDRFSMIYKAVKLKYPEIQIVGTSGPFPDGEDYDKGWEVADKLAVPIIDEHMYKHPDWFWSNLERYDSYNREKSQVYVGEWAAHIKYEGSSHNQSTVEAALSEAAFLTSLERNGDIVKFSSYAPLLANLNHVNWRPDLVFFDNNKIQLTPSYDVQKLFGENAIDVFYPYQQSKTDNKFTISTGKISAENKIVVKLINGEAQATNVSLNFNDDIQSVKSVDITILKSDQLIDKKFKVHLQKLMQTDIKDFVQNVPAYSVVNLIFQL